MTELQKQTVKEYIELGFYTVLVRGGLVIMASNTMHDKNTVVIINESGVAEENGNN